MTALTRHVSVHLTPFAPGVAAAAIGERRRWMALWGVTPTQALDALADRLDRRPPALTPRLGPDGELEICAFVDGGLQPLALVPDGLTLDEARQALGDLKQGRFS